MTDSPEARLLVVDDEPNILELLAMSLRYAGFEVASASTGKEALELAKTFRPDVAVLDVMLPDMDGFTLLSRLRGDGNPTPVIFLTAKDDPADRLRGLTVGGDDYITKPFSLEELMARVRIVLRHIHGEGPFSTTSHHLSFADITLDEDTYEAFKAGEQVELSPTEFKLLRYLLVNQGKVLSKAQILDHVWNYDFGGNFNIVESYVSTLRKKLSTGTPDLIHTIRSVGYVLRLPR